MLGDPSDVFGAPAGGGARAGLSRRGVMAAAAGAAAALALPGRRAQAVARAPAGARVADSCILLVADGMSAGSLALLDHYSRVVLGRPSRWQRLVSDARSGARLGMQSTHSADSVVTDSAAASSAWSVGAKCRNGALCVTPDGEKPCPWLVRCGQGGLRSGAVTTTTICHATPAGFYFNWPDRQDYRDIGRGLVASGLDVALGGGSDHVDVEWGAGYKDLAVLRAFDQVKALSDGRVIGTFNAAHMSMVLDRRSDEPRLTSMAAWACQRLGAGGQRFFVQVEAGRVDHAGHANDPMSLLHEMLEFDDTLGVLLDHVEANPRTLLLVTADHATANPGLTFYGRHGIACLNKLASVKHSLEWVFERFKDLPFGQTPEQQGTELARLLGEASGLSIGKEATRTLQRRLAGELVDPSLRRNELTCVLGSIAGNGFGIQWVSPDHTADHVPLLAVGAGAERLPIFMDNTELPAWMAGVLDLAPGKPVA